MKTLIVVGKRLDATKRAPLIKTLEKEPKIEAKICVAAQTAIVMEAGRLLDDPMAYAFIGRTSTRYGDDKVAQRMRHILVRAC